MKIIDVIRSPKRCPQSGGDIYDIAYDLPVATWNEDHLKATGHKTVLGGCCLPADGNAPEYQSEDCGQKFNRLSFPTDAIFEERLRQHHLREPAIGRSGKGHWRHQQPPCVNHVEERNLLLPNLNHRVVECEDVFLPCVQRLLFVGVAHGCKDKR